MRQIRASGGQSFLHHGTRRRAMGQASAGTTHGLQCPDCATDLESALEASNGVIRLVCPGCGGRFRASLPSTAHEKNRAGGHIAWPDHRRSTRAALACPGAQDPGTPLLVGDHRWIDDSACPWRLHSGCQGVAGRGDLRLDRRGQNPRRHLVPCRNNRSRLRPRSGAGACGRAAALFIDRYCGPATGSPAAGTGALDLLCPVAELLPGAGRRR